MSNSTSHPKHDFEGIRSRNLTTTSMRSSLNKYARSTARKAGRSSREEFNRPERLAPKVQPLPWDDSTLSRACCTYRMEFVCIGFLFCGFPLVKIYFLGMLMSDRH